MGLVAVQNLPVLYLGFKYQPRPPGQRLYLQVDACPAGLGHGVMVPAGPPTGWGLLVNHRGRGKGGFQPEPVQQQGGKDLQLNHAGDAHRKLPLLLLPVHVQQRVLLGQLPQLAGDHGPHLPGVDKQRFALLLLAFVEEPQGDRNLGSIEQLGGHGDDAVHQVGLDDTLTDLPLAARLGG